MRFSALRSTSLLPEKTIVAHLKELRSYAWAPLSDYHVATIVEVRKGNHFYYIPGVNIELPGHNRLSLHSEQTALENAIALLGGDIKFSRMWIMAAPAKATPEQEPSAGKSCGHCRQISINLAEPHAKIHTVTLSGKILPPDTFENGFLPGSFSEGDVAISTPAPSAPLTGSTDQKPTLFQPPKVKTWDILKEKRKLTPHQIKQYLQVASPHIVSNEFKTSPITACIAECDNGYTVSALMQDIAFLTTDAIPGVIGNAITQFGNQGLRFREIHLASASLDPGQFSMTEIQLLSEYMHKKTMVHFYTPTGHQSYSFIECVHARYKSLEQQLDENFAKEKNSLRNLERRLLTAGG